MEYWPIIFIAILTVVFRLILGSFDGPRIKSYARSNGWELVSKKWAPFGPGWFGDMSSRLYRMAYRDGQGNLHQANVKTSMFGGVYLANDCIVGRAEPVESADRELGELREALESLRAENERLKARIEELERGGRKGRRTKDEGPRKG